MSHRLLSPLIRKACLLVAGSFLLAPAVGQAERPSAPKLLPRSTLAYLRIDDTQALVDAFRETSVGRIARDDQVRPLLGHLYGSLTQALAGAQEDIGLSLDDLLAIPQGELCLALVAPEEGRPAVAAIVDAGQNLPLAQQLLDFACERAIADGGTVSFEDIDGVELTMVRRRGTPRIAYFLRDQTVVIVTDPGLARQLLAVWDGEPAPTLADNRRFTTIMSRSQGTKSERPQFTWFVEPIDLARRVTRGNVAATTAMAFLPALGLDGLQAIGGSVILATEEFDSIAHFHVMLASPRERVLKMIAFQPGDITPEPWVPRDVASYMTVYWDVEQTYAELQPLYDTFRGEDALAMEVARRISEPLGIDFHRDLMAAFDGRLSLVTWMERPARLNSQSTLVALRMKDGESFQGTLDTIVTSAAPGSEKHSFRGVTYYRFERPGRGQGGAESEVDPLRRRPEPTVAVVGDYVVLTDSVKLFQQVVTAHQQPDQSLASELDFKLIASKFKQHAYGKRPSMISFNRPEEGMRLMYELATNDSTRQRLASQAENNGFFRAIQQALEDHTLPPFSVIARYLAPSGGLLIDDETGLHYTVFGLKRE